MKFEAVIFDLDGTLWDSSETVAASWRKTINENYEPIIQPDGAFVRSLMGMTQQEISDKHFRPYGEKALEICSRCLAEEPEFIRGHGARLFEGLEDMLATLSKSYPLFIVSNCQGGYIESFLYCSGMGKYFTDHTCEGDTGLSKAENIRHIMQRNGIESAIYIGDTASDEKSAKAAGCPFIHAAYGFGSASDPTAAAGELKELPGIIAALAERE